MQPAQGMQQQISPEQMEKQKVDMKAAEMQQKSDLQKNPAMQSPVDKLRAMLLPPRPKLKPQPTMKLIVNNGEILGNGISKNQNGGSIDNPYGSKKTRGLNPRKVIMGQGSGMMGNGQSKPLKKNSIKEQNAR